MVRGEKMVVRASSCLQGPRIFLLQTCSTTIRRPAGSRAMPTAFPAAGSTSPGRKRNGSAALFSGWDAGRTTSLAEFGVATGLRVNSDEKDAFDRRVAWEWGNDGLVYDGLNMCKAIIWFDSGASIRPIGVHAVDSDVHSIAVQAFSSSWHATGATIASPSWKRTSRG